MVWTNDHMYTHGLCQCSWGGVKRSGVGRTHSEHGFRECVTPKLLAWDPSVVPDFWWYPYEEAVPRAVRAAAGVLYGRGARRFRGVREGAAPLARVGWRLLRGAVRR
jgi:succinate-semialdehyde dehydrogenase/glutarate-semialdehyde dehydrogenase